MITRRMQLDVSKPGSQLALYARQGDARVYDVRVSLCEQSVPISVPGDWTAVLRARKPDGTMICDLAAVEDGQIRAYLGTQAFTAAGVMRCELFVFDRVNGQALYSPSFDVYVEAPALPDSDIESSDSFGALMTAFQTVDGYDATLRGLIADMEQAKGAALEAVGEANASASGAEAAKDAANTAAEGANQAAAKIDNMTVDATPVAPGGAPTAAVSEADGHKHVSLGIPAGATGPQGPGYTVKGRAYATAGELAAAVTAPAEGDQYNVGAAPPYNVYRWTGDAWEDQGRVQGQPGRDGVSPQASVSKEGRAATITITDADGTTTAAVMDGASAYELAVAQGYAGSLAEWLAEMLRTENVADNVTTTAAGYVLDARQGKALSDALALKQDEIGNDNASGVRAALGLKSGATREVQRSTATIAAAANSTVTVSIDFPAPFSGTPSVAVSLNTSSPAERTLAVTAVSASGMTVVLYNGTAYAGNLVVYWIAAY